MKKYELSDHTADLAVTVYGGTVKELFENAAFSLFDIIGGEIPDAESVIEKKIILQRESLEELLVEWLNSLLFYFDTEALLFFRSDIKDIKSNFLRAEAFGNQIPAGFSPKTVIKSVTYHNLYIEEEINLWKAGFVADI